MNLFQSENGKIIMSIILGLGFASMFRSVCMRNDCVIIKGPKFADVENSQYKIGDKCYSYNPHPVNCPKSHNYYDNSKLINDLLFQYDKDNKNVLK